jgi:Lrp/AsnC family transcriptional regulator, leucine-responsive regulatory protein
MHPYGLDDINIRMLSHLQRDARASNIELSEVAFLSPPQCYRRVKRLEEEGFIDKFVAVLNREMVGFGVMAIVGITCNRVLHKQTEEFERTLKNLPEVLECYSVTGEFDYLIKVVAADINGFASVLKDKLQRLPGVTGVKSAVCLDNIKCSTALPIGLLSLPDRR